MIRKSAVVKLAGLLSAAAALALMGHIAARAEDWPQVPLKRAPERELGAMKMAAADAPKDQSKAAAAEGRPSRSPPIRHRASHRERR